MILSQNSAVEAACGDAALASDACGGAAAAAFDVNDGDL
jgi:hypothetical protein